MPVIIERLTFGGASSQLSSLLTRMLAFGVLHVITLG